MPLYEYQCEACGQRFEVIRRFSDPPVDVCTACGKGPVTRLLSSPAIQFKGTGWYITDYSQKGKSEAKAAATKGEGSKTDGVDAAKSEASKSDAGSKSDTPAATPSGGGSTKD